MPRIAKIVLITRSNRGYKLVKDCKLDAEYSKYWKVRISKFVNCDYTAAIEGYNAALIKHQMRLISCLNKSNSRKNRGAISWGQQEKSRTEENAIRKRKPTYLNIMPADQFLLKRTIFRPKGNYREALTDDDEQYPKDQWGR